MGLKAVNLLFRAIMVVFSIVVLGFAILGLLSAKVNPADNNFMPFIGLLIPLILFVSIALIVFWIFNKSHYWMIIPALAIVINYQYIFSMVQINIFGSGSKTQNSLNLKVATYNIHGFNYLYDDVSVNYIADYISQEKVSILCMQEFMAHTLFNLNELKGAFDNLPFSTIHNDGTDEIGLAIFSKFPIIAEGQIHFDSTNNAAQWADIEMPDGKSLRIINAHLQTTGISRSSDLTIEKRIGILYDNFVLRAKQADILRSLLDSTKTPVILCGDFNDTPSSYVYNRLMGDNMVDGFREAGSGLGSTFLKKFNLLRIDYIMYSREFEGIRYYSKQKTWSDHNPILTELEYRN